MSIGDSLLSPLYSGGQAVGVTIGGFIYIPFNQGGIIMQDSSGALWVLSIGTDGRLTTGSITL